MLPLLPIPLGSGRALSTYALLYALAFGIAFVWIRSRLINRGLEKRQIYAIAGLAIGGSWAGAHLLPPLVLLAESPHLFGEPARIVALFQNGGTMFLGGFLGAFAFLAAYARGARMPLLAILDATAPPLALAASIGRLGCFAAGCCGGRPTDLPIGVLFPGSAVRVHPTQLYASALDLLILFVLLRQDSRQRPPGQLFLLFVTLYSTKRLFLESIRDEPRVAGPFTTAQLVSTALLAAVLVVWWRGRLRRLASPEST